MGVEDGGRGEREKREGEMDERREGGEMKGRWIEGER